ncbi:uncharacterized protein GGS22DRAFT_187231 [Annulohypoxylon maeteangense]|uniref:uncharacterized protein n=1 Tax=Annulohypoxylon maeteangense TaxID=1927788 RepID=UPI002008BD71|nr:uncharacterized protein GGS22DRAFT_187231 [Annulohypoxylon maeteangense]KAI0886000.1 hypothetical protein GGS22DRAFT_187231 [Annulohypoxylon maeteangense]
MQIFTIVATALLPLLAVAETSTTTSTMTMTKYITIQKVATSSVFSVNSTTVFPTGTISGSAAIVTATTTTGADGSPTTVAPTVSPTIDNQNSGAMLAPAAFAGFAGIVFAAMIAVWLHYMRRYEQTTTTQTTATNHSTLSVCVPQWSQLLTNKTNPPPPQDFSPRPLHRC